MSRRGGCESGVLLNTNLGFSLQPLVVKEGEGCSPSCLVGC